jgi:hypothetical protein
MVVSKRYRINALDCSFCAERKNALYGPAITLIKTPLWKAESVCCLCLHYRDTVDSGISLTKVR